MRNVTLIARREYKEQIRGRAFLLSTILLPVVFVLLFGIGYLTTLSLGSNKHIVIVAENHSLAELVRDRLLKKKNNKLTVDVAPPTSANDRAAILQRLKSKSIDGMLVIDTSSSGVLPAVTYTSASAGDFMSTSKRAGAQ